MRCTDSQDNTRNTLQHTTTRCNTPQHTATHCNTLQHTRQYSRASSIISREAIFAFFALPKGRQLQHTATHCNPLQPTATHCNTLQPTATHCNTLQHTATHCNTLQHTATHCNPLQHTATHRNTLQPTATHCNTPGSTVAPAASYRAKQSSQPLPCCPAGCACISTATRRRSQSLKSRRKIAPEISRCAHVPSLVHPVVIVGCQKVLCMRRHAVEYI